VHPVLDALDARRAALDRPPLEGLGGHFHSHVTLRVPADLDGGARARLEHIARAQRSKLTVIDLADLATRVERDVMLTRHFVEAPEGGLGRIADALRRTVVNLVGAGVEPVRVKVEHESEPSLSCYDAEHYHEVHIKLAIAPADHEVTLAWLKQVGASVGWRPSRNPYERRSDQITQFVTMRAYEGDRPTVDARVEVAEAALRERGLVPLEIKRETTVLDTRREHDAWWV